jgi:hypothetical protein
MKKNHSIHNWELYHKIKGNKISYQKEFMSYKKPFLGRILDKICVFGQKLIKKPIFSILFLLNLTLLLEYGRCSYFGDHIDLFRWVTTGSFLVFFGYLTFFDKN